LIEDLDREAKARLAVIQKLDAYIKSEKKEEDK